MSTCPCGASTREGCGYPAVAATDRPAECLAAALVEFLTYDEFIAQPEPQAEPLVVDTEGSTVVPAAGLIVVYGNGGAGETTLVLDGTCHWAAGTAWLDGLATPARPLSVVWIENEGPREEFRRKLERKMTRWADRVPAERFRVYAQPWAAFDLRDETHRQALADAVAAFDADIAIIGPLSRLGMEGGGTPDEVRAFVRLLEDVQRRVTRPVSIVVLHHENRAGQISGAWEGVPDLLVHVQAQGNGHTRVYWQKARWSSTLHGTTSVLAWRDGEGFELEEKPPVTAETIGPTCSPRSATTPAAHGQRYASMSPAGPPRPRRYATGSSSKARSATRRPQKATSSSG